MGTQGLVTIVDGGSVVMKIVAGCNGNNATTVAQAILAKWPVTIVEAYKMATLKGFGSKESLVVITSDNFLHYCDEDLTNLYRETFDQPRFNPRWHHGTADYIEVIDVTKAIPEIKTAKEEVPKWKMIDTKMMLIGPINELMKEAQITQDDIEKFYVMNIDEKSGQIMTYEEMMTLEIKDIGGWNRIGQRNVNC